MVFIVIMSNENTDSFDPSCCTMCKADVETSRNAINGPPADVYDQFTRNNGYPDDAGAFKRKWELVKIQLNRLSATIALLNAEKRRLKEIVEQYQAILHPIRAAPTDVLRHVFRFCSGRDQGQEILDEAVPISAKSSLRPKEMPWVLGQVCQSWRKLVLSTPELWTVVSIDVWQPDSAKQRISSNVLRLGLQLDRSQNLPLTVTISCPNAPSYDRPDPVLDENNPLLVLLCASSRRWRHLRLEGHLETRLGRMAFIRGLLPELESLYIGLDVGSSIPIWEREARSGLLADCFEFAPRLTSVSFHNYVSTKLPWQQIITYVSNEILSYLKTRGAVLYQTLKTPTDYGTLSRPRLTSNNDLTVLELGFVGGTTNDHIAVFLSLLAPHLEKLSIVRAPSERGSSYEDSIVADVLEYRWNTEDTASVSQLRVVSLDRKITDDSTRERLETLIGQGMVITEGGA
ncbi:hypothetical protein VNI00_006797 [Paramarasmius palmivorus]|uniref:F-box domain-containing protein n=1 Tax=Paramarasmius palmivorus TaxID=297713 RepID=A0AAW0D847_9AGAR